MSIQYTPQKMFLLAFSFANFETTRGSRRKAYISFLYLTIKVNYPAQKKLLLKFQNSQMKKRGETLFRDCMYHEISMILTIFNQIMSERGPNLS